jgi:hypothetical protein
VDNSLLGGLGLKDFEVRNFGFLMSGIFFPTWGGLKFLQLIPVIITDPHHPKPLIGDPPPVSVGRTFPLTIPVCTHRLGRSNIPFSSGPKIENFNFGNHNW